jgi:hypothetical protein
MNDIKAESIARDIISNPDKSQTSILKPYYPNMKTLTTNTSKILSNNKIQHFLKRFRDENTEVWFSNLNEIANIETEVPVYNKAGEVVDVVQDARLLSVKAKTNQDLVDRAGHTKINKSITITKKVDSIDNIDELDKRMRELEEKSK